MHRSPFVYFSQFTALTHLNDVWVAFRNTAGTERLQPGMSGQAHIELLAATGTTRVPFPALVNDGVDRFVLVEEANAADLSEYRRFVAQTFLSVRA